MVQEDQIKAVVEDVEEGEISDTASVEEISEEDFNKKEQQQQQQDTATNKQREEVKKVISDSSSSSTSTSTATAAANKSGVWTVQDLYKYGGRRYPAASLYNLAWAQAVQNKPLNEIFVIDDENSKRPSPSPSNSTSTTSSSVNNNGKDAKEIVVIDDEMDKEEGELEEGEIDMDSDSNPKPTIVEEGKTSTNGVDVEKRVNLIREALESVTVVNAEKSFKEVCSKLQSNLESLRELVPEMSVSIKDAFIQLAFTASKVVHSVFSSMNQNLKGQSRDILSRLTSFVKSHDPPLFSPEQMKEIEVMSAKGDGNDKERVVIDEVNQKDSTNVARDATHDLTSANKLPSAIETSVYNKPNMPSEAMKPGLSGFRSRGVLLPLLDLHKDHDEDSLPSPTRETAPSLPMHKTLAAGDGMANSGLPTSKVSRNKDDSKLHPYETDAVKAVSTYQQKFGHSSFISSANRLPSPTPSEESADGDGDIGGEVSSSSGVGNFKPISSPIVGVPITSASSPMDNPSMQGLTCAINAPIVGSGSNPAMKASAKTRDPRLRFVNPNVSTLDLNQQPLHMVPDTSNVEPGGAALNSRKQKTAEDPILDGPALKRQKNGLENSGAVNDLKNAFGCGGWLEDSEMTGPHNVSKNMVSDPRKMNNGVTCPNIGNSNPSTPSIGNEPVPPAGTNATGSLPALLRDIVVNPTMLINILKMGQQPRLTTDTQQKSTDPVLSTLQTSTSNSILGAVPLVNIAPTNPSGILPRPAGALPVASQMSAMDELGKIRMKPRDPRRVLHGNALQRSGSLGSEPLRTNGPSTSNIQKDNLIVQKQEGQAETKPMPSQSVPPPDITRQFTKSLKNIADIISVSQAITTPAIVPQNIPTQTAQIKLDRVDVNAENLNSEDQRTGTSSAPQGGVAALSRPQNSWVDVEHLFEGYDDQQKAAIQRERARRMEEQKKMFTARKLCLVLDLDHTLLNSAKFIEVDQVHDEILRKKEEQDREKPYRHLFRFPHMGMWTKLRPGIWNFLERASKLYELHLYTMGNKLYATEMAKVLDPKGVLFNGRVISRGDDGDPFDGDERVPKSKDLEGVLGMESAVVIIDDSVRVWPHNKLNLIVVERYTYFPCSRRQFGLPGPSLLEIDVDERPEDGTLASSLAVIERIHQIFFSHLSLDDVDVRNILASEQQKILAGCRIVFSRVFPVGEANPHLHPLWQTAEQFGAVCTNQIDEQVTHVVANSLGTDKVNWALSTGRFVVHPGWVEASALLYRRANEQDFAIKP